MRWRGELLVMVGLMLAVAGCGSSANVPATVPPTASVTTTSSSPTASATTTTQTTTIPKDAGPELMPLEHGPQLAPASTTATGQPVNGILCQRLEELAYQAHAHLQVYVYGKRWVLPGGIGVVQPSVQQTDYGPYYTAQLCYYWLHTHAADGIIHVESPKPRRFTLGDFFDVWQQHLSRYGVATQFGRVTAIVNGRRWRGSPRAIPLREHEAIQLAVGTPVPRFHRVHWAITGF